MGRFRNFFRELFRLNVDYVLNAITWRSPQWLFYYYHTLLISTDNPRLLTRSNPTYFLRFVTGDDMPLLRKFALREQAVAEHLAAGDRCVIMGRDDEIMSIIWGSSDKRYFKLSGAVLDPGKDGVIIYGGFTTEEARFKGLFPTSFQRLYQSYVDEGRPRIYAAIHSTNTASMKLHLRMGFEIVGETYFLALFGLKICYYRKWPHATRRLHIFVKVPPDNLGWV